MDANLLASAGVSSSSIIGLYVAYKIFLSIKGRRLVSDCCGKKLEVGVDVREMVVTPTDRQETQRDLEVGFPKSSASHSLPESASEVVESLTVLETHKSDHTHRRPTTVEDTIVPVLSGLTISVPTLPQVETPIRTPPIPSLPRILEG